MLEHSVSRLSPASVLCLTIVCFAALAACTGPGTRADTTWFSQGDVHRGQYLTKVFCCQECHTVRQTDGIHLDSKMLFTGGNSLPTLDGSSIHTANVTLASQYPEQLLENIIRGRLTYKFWMPTDLYNGMAADDMRDVIAFVKTLKPIRRPLPDNYLPKKMVLPAPNPPIVFPEHEPRVGTVERGEYLSRMFLCYDCHSPRDSTGAYLQGHPFEGGGLQLRLNDGRLLVAPNLTADMETGLGTWSEADIIRAFRTGVARDGRQLNHWMPYEVAFHDMSDQDTSDLVRFLRTLKPVRRSWP